MIGWQTVRDGQRLLVPILLVLGLVAVPAAQAQTPAEIQAALDAAHAKYQTLKEGKNADYIPALAKVDSNIYGIALVTTDGKVYTAGDIKSEVSIQSISKVFTMALVMEESGVDAIAGNMGVDATGQVFNSIVAVEQYKGGEMNAMVNPGAITATSMVKGANRDEIWKKILATYSDFAGRSLSVNQEVFKSEADTNQRNQAISMLIYAYGRIKDNPLQARRPSTPAVRRERQRKDLATMAATLANGGKDPVTGEQVRRERPHARDPRGDGSAAGLYDELGKWLFATALPGKSGVGGGILACSRESSASPFRPPRCGRQQREGAEGHRRHSNELGGTRSPRSHGREGRGDGRVFVLTFMNALMAISPSCACMMSLCSVVGSRRCTCLEFRDMV